MNTRAITFPALVRFSSHRAFIGFLGLGGFLLGLLLFAAMSHEATVRSQDRALATSAILFLPSDEPGLDEDAAAQLSAVLIDQGLVRAANVVPRARQVAAVAGLIGSNLGAPEGLEDLPLAAVIELEFAASGPGKNAGQEEDLARLLALARASNPDATLIDFSLERGLLADEKRPMRLLFAVALVAISALLLIAASLVARVMVLAQAQVWRTLLLVGAEPSFLLARFGWAFARAALFAAGCGLLLSGLALVITGAFTAEPVTWLAWLLACLLVLIVLVGLLVLVARQTVSRRIV